MKEGKNSMRARAINTWYEPMIAVLLANTSSALALIATSVCSTTLPKWPPSRETTWPERYGSLTTLAGSKIVESIVNSGLVMPMVNTTSKRAMPATFLRGAFITGESCEMLSRPEKARNDPAKPTRIVVGPSTWFWNILGKSERKVENERCVKTVMRMAMSLAKAITAPTRLTFALSLMLTQLRIPSKINTTMVTSSAMGSRG